MKALATLIVAGLLSGCAGLNVSWSVNASYNTTVVNRTASDHLQKENK